MYDCEFSYVLLRSEKRCVTRWARYAIYSANNLSYVRLQSELSTNTKWYINVNQYIFTRQILSQKKCTFNDSNMYFCKLRNVNVWTIPTKWDTSGLNIMYVRLQSELCIIMKNVMYQKNDRLQSKLCTNTKWYINDQ